MPDESQPAGNFAEGQDDREQYPQDSEVGRFDEGQVEDPGSIDKEREGQFPEGQQERQDEREGRYDDENE